VEHYTVRVWLPDRPGALGQVASRLGAVRGDVVGIEILERGGGRAIDELIVALPEPGLVDLLVNEISQVEDVDVEDVRFIADPMRDARLDALETATRLVEAPDVEALFTVLCADAFAVLHKADTSLSHAVGVPPEAAWLVAFLEGSRVSEAVAAGAAGPDDVAWAPLPAAGHELVLGRKGRPLRGRERRELAALARIADTRWQALH
jgi:hypothetical protein